MVLLNRGIRKVRTGSTGVAASWKHLIFLRVGGADLIGNQRARGSSLGRPLAARSETYTITQVFGSLAPSCERIYRTRLL